MARDWTRSEVDATVVDYFAMLADEVSGRDYSKTAHRRTLLGHLDDRTDAAVERKHGNISAVLRDLGFPWIDGYKPYSNYQALLADAVQEHLEANPALRALIEADVTAEALLPAVPDLAALWEQAPEPEGRAAGGTAEGAGRPYGLRVRAGVDYLAMESRNRSLGLAGEELVLQIEARRLHALGQRRLADRVEHVARTKGDGLGYDVHSFEADGRDRLIEVKTTRYGKRTPFFVSRNELACSQARGAEYRLYRLFRFREAPRLFELAGQLDQSCRLEPSQFLARAG